MTTLMGVDGCKDGWIATVEKGQEQPPCCERSTSIGALMEQAPAIIAIDVPIGLLERGMRRCDAEAKRLLGVRQSSVFPAPIRPTLKATSHSEASALRFEVEGKRMSLQVWGE
jgi:predicted RNase H-like nuclease